ncbi:hypothetical protein NW765_001367 [Fusarium oxysporum]|nr:hypothetical protein NW765_001367 [Fusarium oxysporum]
MASSIEAVNNDVILHSQKAQQVYSAGAIGRKKKKKKKAELVAFFAHTELSYAVSGFGQQFGKFGCWFEFIGGGIKTENWKLSREMLGLDFRLQWKPARAGFPQWHKSPGLAREPRVRDNGEVQTRLQLPYRKSGLPKTH